jgi:DNA-directed RNA polymerase specialized sigma subunit
MGMTARGHEVLEQARTQLIQAKSVEQLRQAQAVILPLSYGLSLEQTADVLGISASWTCKLRTRFARGEVIEPDSKCGHRPRQNS